MHLPRLFSRHSRESGRPAQSWNWIPAFAGITVVLFAMLASPKAIVAQEFVLSGIVDCDLPRQVADDELLPTSRMELVRQTENELRSQDVIVEGMATDIARYMVAYVRSSFDQNRVVLHCGGVYSPLIIAHPTPLPPIEDWQKPEYGERAPSYFAQRAEREFGVRCVDEMRAKFIDVLVSNFTAQELRPAWIIIVAHSAEGRIKQQRSDDNWYLRYIAERRTPLFSIASNDDLTLRLTAGEDQQVFTELFENDPTGRRLFEVYMEFWREIQRRFADSPASVCPTAVRYNRSMQQSWIDDNEQ